jgi:SAM-dependent methyltransferase
MVSSTPVKITIEGKFSKDLDHPKTTIIHSQIIKKKKFLNKLYEEWYSDFLSTIENLSIEGKILELGSGGGFLKELKPDIITSDILDLPDCDICCSAANLPFQEESLKGVFMLDVLHHLPNSKIFFKEIDRILKKGGIVYMIEPANTTLSSFILKNFHHEDFNPNTPDWTFESLGPLSSSNQALPWIIFFRDRKIFEKKFPELNIKIIQLHTPFRYLICGGLSYNIQIPGWSFKFISLLEKIFRPFYGNLAMFQTIVLEKK